MSVPILKPFEVTLQIGLGRMLLEGGNKVTSLLECSCDQLHIMCDDVRIYGSPIPIYVTVDPREIAAVGKPQFRKSVCS